MKLIKLLLLGIILCIMLSLGVNAVNISNCTELQAIPDETTLEYNLINDIDCSDTVNWNGGGGFIPLIDFSGQFYGHNYSIINFTIDEGGQDNKGLFNTIEANHSGVIIDSIVFENSYIKGNDIIGVLAGNLIIPHNATYLPTISNINITDAYVYSNAGNYYAGLIGIINGGYFYNNYFQGTVTGFGFTSRNGVLTGIKTVGDNISLIVDRFSADLDSFKMNNRFGGLIGEIWSRGDNQNVYINNTKIVGDTVDSTSSIYGGFIGYLGLDETTNSVVVIENSYTNLSNVDFFGVDTAVNIVSPEDLIIRNTFHFGSADDGFSDSDSTLSDNYYVSDYSIFSGESAGEYESLTISEAQDPSNFNNFDFGEIWGMSDVNGFPCLLWETDCDVKSPTLSSITKTSNNTDTTAEFDVTTDINSNCEISLDNITYVACGVTDTTSHECNSTTVSPGWDSFYFNCSNIGDSTAYITELQQEFIYTEDTLNITNCVELSSIESGSTNSYQLMNDIDCSDTINWEPNGGINRGGLQSAVNFQGTFEGNGYNITNLYINTASQYNGGLFEVFASGSNDIHIRNFNVINPIIIGQASVGVIVPHVENKAYRTYVSNISVINATVSGTHFIGGAFGDVGHITATNIHYQGNVEATLTNAGGLVGYLELDSTLSGKHTYITNCSAIITNLISPSVNFKAQGTLIGFIDGGNTAGIEVVINGFKGSVANSTGQTNWKGGFFGGYSEGTQKTTITVQNSYIDSDTTFITSAYNSNDDLSEFNFNYNYIKGTAVSLSGSSLATFNYQNNYYDSDELAYSGDITGEIEPLTSDEMLQTPNFENWNFTTTWGQNPSTGAICLRWEDNCEDSLGYFSEISYIRLLPTILLENETISASALATDLDSTNINFTFKLYVNNSVVETINVAGTNNTQKNQSFSYATVIPNEIIKIGAFTTNGLINGTEQFSDNFTVRSTNNAPTVSTLRINPNVLVGEDDDVTGYCTGIDSDSDTIKYNYKWFVSGVLVKSGTVINTEYYGYTEGVEREIDTISNTNYNETDTLIFSCGVYDAKDSSVYSNTSSILIYAENNFIPIVRTVNLIPVGEHDTNQDFDVQVNTTDYDDSTITYEYRFIKNGIYQSIGTTGSFTQNLLETIIFLNATDTVVDDSFYARVRAYDGTVFSDWKNSNVVTINNSIPQMTVSDIITTPNEENNLSGNCTGTDVDSEQTLTFTKKWYIDGSLEYTGDILSYSFTQSGETVILGCIASDTINSSSQLNSSGVTILNTNNTPTMTSSTLVANTTQLSGICLGADLDGDLVNYTFNWYKNGASVNNGNTGLVAQNINQELNLVTTITGADSWVLGCSLTDNDDGTSIELNSSAFVIPTITFLPVVSDVGITNINTEWTTNADEIKIYLNDTLQATTTLGLHLLEDLTPSTTYNVKLIPVKDNFDGESVSFNETTLTTDNNAPVMTNTEISPATVYTEDSVSGICSASDIDNNQIFFTYAWKIDGVTVDSGLSTLYNRNTNITLSSLTSSNYVYNQNITFECTAFDGLGNSGLSSTSLLVSNTEPVVTEENINIEIIDDQYECTYSYSDVDGDSEVTPSYRWFNNNILQSSLIKNYNISDTSIDDELICEVMTGDIYHNVTKNSSIFKVGDFAEPVVSNINVPTSAFSDSSVLISAECSDDTAIDQYYPKIRFINPNFVEEEYQLTLASGTLYTKYQIFNIPGVYTNFEVECQDGNNNKDILQYSGTLTSNNRETSIITSGSGSSSTTTTIIVTDDLRNITSFSISPENLGVSISPGAKKQLEFTVTNDDIVDIDFTTAVLVSGDKEVYDWISFDVEKNQKAITYTLEKAGGLSNNNIFINYYLTIPDDTPLGIYNGIIEINGLERVEQHKITIEVREGAFFNLFSFFDLELFEIPFTSTFNDEVNTVTGEVENLSFTGSSFVITSLLTISLLGGFIYFRRL